MAAIDARKAEKLHEFNNNSFLRKRIRSHGKPRPAGMSNGKNCPKHPKAESILATRLKDYETIKNKGGYHIPGSLQFR